jgi:hypothetical protein
MSRYPGTSKYPEPDPEPGYLASGPKRVAIPADGTTLEVDFSELAPPEDKQLTSPSNAVPNPQASLPVWLRHDCKVTIDARGAYHKGYIEYAPEHGFRFAVRKNPRSRKVDWFEPLPDFAQHWTTLVSDDVLVLPGHGTISSFLKPNSSNNAPICQFCLRQESPPSLPAITGQSPASL